MQNLEVVRSPLKTMTLERTTGSRAAPVVITYPAGEQSAVTAAQVEVTSLPFSKSMQTPQTRNDSR
jgi:hypothetical protein